eukprot:5096686-Pyramimonas_sp.AAC.1
MKKEAGKMAFFILQASEVEGVGTTVKKDATDRATCWPYRGHALNITIAVEGVGTAVSNIHLMSVMPGHWITDC